MHKDNRNFLKRFQPPVAFIETSCDEANLPNALPSSRPILDTCLGVVGS